MADKDKVTIMLDTPLTNISDPDPSKRFGGKYNGQNNTETFFGKVTVDEATAEDLMRRQNEWHEHQNNLHRDNGQRDLNAGGFTGNQA